MFWLKSPNWVSFSCRMLEDIKAECSTPNTVIKCFHGDPLWCCNEAGVAGYYYSERQWNPEKDGCWAVERARGRKWTRVSGWHVWNSLSELWRSQFDSFDKMSKKQFCRVIITQRRVAHVFTKLLNDKTVYRGFPKQSLFLISGSHLIKINLGQHFKHHCYSDIWGKEIIPPLHCFNWIQLGYFEGMDKVWHY